MNTGEQIYRYINVFQAFIKTKVCFTQKRYCGVVSTSETWSNARTVCCGGGVSDRQRIQLWWRQGSWIL